MKHTLLFHDFGTKLQTIEISCSGLKERLAALLLAEDGFKGELEEEEKVGGMSGGLCVNPHSDGLCRCNAVVEEIDKDGGVIKPPIRNQPIEYPARRPVEESKELPESSLVDAGKSHLSIAQKDDVVCKVCYSPLYEEDDEEMKYESMSIIMDGMNDADLMEILEAKQQQRAMEEQTKVFRFQACAHAFHGECLREYLQMQINESKFPLCCLMPECKEQITVSDLRLILPPETFYKFEQRSLAQAIDFMPDLSWCPTPDCNFAYVKDPRSSAFYCPNCLKRYCTACSQQAHPGLTCDENKVNNEHTENDDKFLEHVQNSQYKQCPKCKFWVSRVEGCHHMTCRCRHEFCYVCGGDYPCRNCRHQHFGIIPMSPRFGLQLRR